MSNTEEFSVEKKRFIDFIKNHTVPTMPLDASEHDIESVGWSAATAYDYGLDIGDAIAYVYTFQEVCLHTDEAIAMGTRRQLRLQYDGKQRVPGATLL